MKRWRVLLRSPRLWAIAAVLIAGFALLYHEFDIKTVQAEAEKLPGWICFLALTLLPLIGFPASVLHVGAGLRFGIPLGLALVWLSILLQLLASYGLVHWKHKFFERRFRSIRKRIPPGSHVSVTVFTMLIPGAPYFAQNYTLPLIGIPLRLFLLICLPMHAVRSSVAVIFGGQSHELTLGRMLLILAYGALILSASWWALHRLKTRLGDPRQAGSGRKQRA